MQFLKQTIHQPSFAHDEKAQRGDKCVKRAWLSFMAFVSLSKYVFFSWCHDAFIITRPYAALRAAGLDWIVRLYYSLGWVHFEREYTFWECILKGNVFFESALKLADCFFVWKYFSSYLISLLEYNLLSFCIFPKLDFQIHFIPFWLDRRLADLLFLTK